MLGSRRIRMLQEYVYLRTKNVFINDDNELEIFVFAGLTKNTLSHDDFGKKKHVESVVAKVMEFSMAEAPRDLIVMDNEDFRFIIDQTVFEMLCEQAENDTVAFCTYEPSK